MIDVSDGLAADLHHILDESGVGATIRAADLPISEAALRIDDLRTPVEHALSDGEDFELLFTVSPEDGSHLCVFPPRDVRLSHIGEITAERTCTLIDSDGKSTPLPPLGWVHSLGESHPGERSANGGKPAGSSLILLLRASRVVESQRKKNRRAYTRRSPTERSPGPRVRRSVKIQSHPRRRHTSYRAIGP